MVTDLEAVNQAVNDYVADVMRVMPIDKAFLYGSFTKGTNNDSSDVDICFFSSDFEHRRTVDVLTQLIKLTRIYRDIDIEPRAFPTSAIEADNPFVKEVLRTGREIALI